MSVSFFFVTCYDYTISLTSCKHFQGDASKNECRHHGQFWCSDEQKHKTYRCTVIYDIQTCFIPLGHITSIDQQPTCPSHLSLDSLLVSPHQCPVSQSKGRESKGATYQVDYQGVLLWLIKMECAHNEGCSQGPLTWEGTYCHSAVHNFKST